MPNIDKPKKTSKKTFKLPKSSNLPKKANLPTKPKSPQSPHDYYCCCAEQTKQGIPKGTKITQLTKHCKQNAQKLRLAHQKVRATEKKKIFEHWKQIGVSLGKIIESA